MDEPNGYPIWSKKHLKGCAWAAQRALRWPGWHARTTFSGKRRTLSWTHYLPLQIHLYVSGNVHFSSSWSEWDTVRLTLRAPARRLVTVRHWSCQMRPKYLTKCSLNRRIGPVSDHGAHILSRFEARGRPRGSSAHVLWRYGAPRLATGVHLEHFGLVLRVSVLGIHDETPSVGCQCPHRICTYIYIYLYCTQL